MRVAVMTATTMNAPTMTTPPNAPKRRKYGPHSRPRDEMETKENVVGSTLDDEERMTFVPSPHFSAHCPMQPPAIHLPTSQPHLGPPLSATGTPSPPEFDLWIVPPTTLSTRLKGKRKGGRLTKSIEQVDHHRANGLASPHEKL